jgi:hypothetical protein
MSAWKLLELYPEAAKDLMTIGHIKFKNLERRERRLAKREKRPARPYWMLPA